PHFSLFLFGFSGEFLPVAGDSVPIHASAPLLSLIGNTRWGCLVPGSRVTATQRGVEPARFSRRLGAERRPAALRWRDMVRSSELQSRARRYRMLARRRGAAAVRRRLLALAIQLECWARELQGE